MTALCTYEAVMFGVGLGPCGEPAESLVRGVCPAGHLDEAPACAEHTAVITDPDRRISCLPCYLEGPPAVYVTSTVAGPVVHDDQLALELPAGATP